MTTEALARFGYHPDPSTDFCLELEELEGWAEDVKAGTRSQWPFWQRLSRLLAFARSPQALELDDIALAALPTAFDFERRVTKEPQT